MAEKKMNNPNSLKNLSKPGMTNNPAGKPKGAISSYKSFAQQMFAEMLEKDIKKKGNTKQTQPFIEAYLESFMKSAIDGGWASKFMAESLFGDNVLEQIDKQLNKSRKEDLDFLSYRIFKDCHNIQQKILLDRNKFAFLMAGRRAGKSEADARKACDVAVSKPNALILFIGLTFTRSLDVFYKPMCDLFDNLSIGFKTDRTEGKIILDNGSEVYFKGNSTVLERDKIRGSKWDLVIIDEVQSQPALPYLINDIIEPTLVDRKGQCILSGTGPRVRGTYWEELWSNAERYKASRYNWNISDNPFIPDYEKVLENIRTEKNMTDTNPLYLREWLGKISYDDDALVYRLNEENYYDDAYIDNWIKSQPITDVRLTAGLDYGFVDSDAFVIIMFSVSRKERFIVYDYKANRTGVIQLAEEMKKGIDFVHNKYNIVNKDFYIYCDTAGGTEKITYDLYNTYNLPVLNAYKADKDMAVEMLQDEVRQRTFKVRKGSTFDDEALKTIFKRNDKDELTRIVDDDTFHPDLLDAVLYSLREIWINYQK